MLTDLEVYLFSIEENIRANLAGLEGKCEAAALDWESEPPARLLAAADTVLLADCIYYEASLALPALLPRLLAPAGQVATTLNQLNLTSGGKN